MCRVAQHDPWLPTGWKRKANAKAIILNWSGTRRKVKHEPLLPAGIKRVQLAWTNHAQVERDAQRDWLCQVVGHDRLVSRILMKFDAVVSWCGNLICRSFTNTMLIRYVNYNYGKWQTVRLLPSTWDSLWIWTSCRDISHKLALHQSWRCGST